MEEVTNIQPQGKFEKMLPGILTAIGISSFFAAVFSGIKDTPKALKQIKQAEELNGGVELEPIEVIKTAAPTYIPTIIFMVAGTACIVSSDVIQYKNIGGLMSLGLAAEKAAIECKNLVTRKDNEINEYKQALLDKFGEETEKLISTQVEQKAADKVDISSVRIINDRTSPDQELFIDDLTGQAFWSTETEINNAIIELNQLKQSGEDIDGSCWTDVLNLNPSAICRNVYWSSSDTRVIKVHFVEDQYHQYKTVKFDRGCGPRGEIKM